mmetsp:Transcript_10024/g.26017  ORF Transcript_10024/g.26017 Transcript_10024/m.26017 type:complete len:182 (-) Transcript_10024:8271-8816(-)
MMRTVLLGLALGVSSGGATTMFMNPLIPSDAPDPGCLVVDTKYICTHTFENDAGVFPIYSSSDMVEWTYEGPALDYYTSNITSWAIDDHWAPEIHPSPANDGTYLLYHTALTKDNKLCLGVAHSDSATGPFSDSHEYRKELELAFPILVLPSVLGIGVPSEFKSKYQDRKRKFTTHLHHVT